MIYIDYRTQYHPCSNVAVEPIDYRTQYHPCSNGAVEPVDDRTQCHHCSNGAVEPFDYTTKTILVRMVLWNLLIIEPNTVLENGAVQPINLTAVMIRTLRVNKV